MSLDRVIGDMNGRGIVDADVGIEVEIETASRNEFPAVRGWNRVGDGSLRGNSIEYTSSPMKIDDVDRYVTLLRESLSSNGIGVRESIRAGVHVHINCSNLTFKQTMMFAMVYYIAEDTILELCGENRIGNLFCLRAKDAEAVIDTAIRAMKAGDIFHFDTNNIRYSSLNYVSLLRFGTLEFRTMSTKENLADLEVWVKTLHRLKEWSMRFKEFQEVITYFSEVGAESFVEEALGDYAKYYNLKDKGGLIVDGMRCAQEIAHYQYM